jgi:predicted nucleic acid-binding protein
MTIFVDTSGILAVMNADDRFHAAGIAIWRHWADDRPRLVTSNYVVLESVALLQRRMGMEAVRSFHQDILPLVQMKWVTAEIHHASIVALFAANRRHLSLVDCSSFEVMRSLNVRQVFAFDPHFAEQGFTCLP